jgi:hypothetical protein
MPPWCFSLGSWPTLWHPGEWSPTSSTWFLAHTGIWETKEFSTPYQSRAAKFLLPKHVTSNILRVRKITALTPSFLSIYSVYPASNWPVESPFPFRHHLVTCNTQLLPPSCLDVKHVHSACSSGHCVDLPGPQPPQLVMRQVKIKKNSGLRKIFI